MEEDSGGDVGAPEEASTETPAEGSKDAPAGGNSSCPVVCGVISGTQADFAQRYHTCAAAQDGEGFIMEYDGKHTFDNDLGFHVPDDHNQFRSKERERLDPTSSTAATGTTNETGKPSVL